MNQTVTFDGAPPPGTINLGIGQPSGDLLPVDLLRLASEAFFKDAEGLELNYGALRGDQRFLHTLAGFLTDAYAAAILPESLLVTGGNSQALDLVATVFAKPGDTVFVEEPSYFLAFQMFRDHGLNIVGIPIDQDGLDLEYLQRQLTTHRPALVYTIPTFHNPGGQTLSLGRRQKLVELSKQHGFLIIADEVYHLLSYQGTPPPAFGTLIDSETVVSLGSFSKILAPALRLGWLQTAPGLMSRLLANGLINSGGSINHFTSHLVRLAIELGLQTAHLEHLRTALGSRLDAMEAALQTHFAGIAEWTRPSGGYFFWLRFAEGLETAALKQIARHLQTGFQPGNVFSSHNGFGNYARLSFAHYNEDEILEGVKRLRPVFD